MKNLIYKELRLTVTPATYFFPLMSLLLLIPSYPYIVAMLYFIFPIQIAFSVARANKDDEFTLMLPVPRKHVVLGKEFVVYLCEIMQLLFAVPCVLLSSLVINKGGNPIGMDANFAFFGYILIAYSIFNIIFIPRFFRTGYKVGVPIIWGMVGFSAFCIIFEVAVAFIPPLKSNLDTLSVSKIFVQIGFFLLGLALYVATFFIANRLANKNYDKVNI